MKKLLFILYISVVIIFQSCHTGPEDRLKNINHFVDCYFDYQTIDITDYYDVSIPGHHSGTLVIMPDDMKYLCGWFKYDTIEGMHNMDLYDSLSMINNDVGFKGDKMIRPNTYMAIDGVNLMYLPYITEINITSAQDFDEDHKSGESWNDMTNILSLSCYPYINSNYTEKYPWTQEEWDEYYFLETGGLSNPYVYAKESQCKYYSPFYKNLADIEDGELKGIAGQRFFSQYHSYYFSIRMPIAFLVFTKTPTLAQTHDISITITLNDGRVFEKLVANHSWE